VRQLLVVSLRWSELPRAGYVRPRRRVVITGLGVISSIGAGPAEFTAALRAGRDGRAPLTAFDTTGFAHSWGSPVLDFDPARWLQRAIPGSNFR